MKKIVKIVILSFMILAMISVSVCAIYTSGDANTTRYYSPVRFDFEVFGTTAELTPTISYNSTSGVEVNSIETSTSPNNVLNSIRRINYSIGTTQSTVIDCAYRLWFELNESVDSFSMKITAFNGLFNFTKYGIPQLSVPTGYSVTANFNYHYHFTQDQSWTEQKGYTYSKSYEFGQGDVIDLLHNRVQIDNVSYAVLGDILIDDYICSLTFTKDTGDTPSQQGGFWLWDSVLDFSTDLSLEEAHSGTPDYFIHFEEPVYIHCLHDGVADTMELSTFGLIDVDGWGTLEMYYDLKPDYNILAYSEINSEWVIWDSDDGEGYIISSDQMRMWQLTTSSFRDSIIDDPSNGRWSADELNRYSTYLSSIEIFLYNNVTYYKDNPLQTVQTSEGATTYAFTDGDGGLYLHYYLDRSLAAQSNNAFNKLYTYGQSNGSGSNPLFNGQFSTWIGNTLVGVFGVEILPGFSFGGILGILLAILLGMLFLKKFAGG